jgi:hypothetical protein
MEEQQTLSSRLNLKHEFLKQKLVNKNFEKITMHEKDEKNEYCLLYAVRSKNNPQFKTYIDTYEFAFNVT